MIRRFVGIVAGLLLLVGCSHEVNVFEQQGNAEGAKTFTSFTATLDDSAVTRAYFNDTSTDGRRQIGWNLSDKILVYSDADTELKTYEMTSLSEDNVATFTGEGVTGEKFYAIFAKRIDCSVDDENSEIVHLSNAYYSSTYGFRGPMVAVSDGNALSFKQTTGVMHVNVGNVKQLGRVRFEGNNNEIIAGSGYIDLSQNQPTLTLDDNANISFMTQVFLQEFDDKYTDIYYVIPPTVFENGFTVTITGTDSEDNEFAITKGYDSRFEVKPATLYSFSLVDITAELEATAADEIIVFADPIAKQICVENWDTNGDGELSYDEAAAVTDIGDKFKEREINSFDEFQYFTGVMLVSDRAFYKCGNLASIVLPDGVTSIGEYAFAHCSSLISIELPESIESIYEGVFLCCDRLYSVVIPTCGGVPDYTFSGCSSLTSIVMSEGVTFIGVEAFAGCNLTSIELPKGVKSIYERAFSSCSSLTSIVLPESVTDIKEYVFAHCSNLASITCLALNPPGYKNVFGEYYYSGYTGIIYVPAASVNAYKTADGWSNYADRIKSLVPAGNIAFADANVKAICVATWDTNNDGELSYEEAAAVTEINLQFQNANYGRTFDSFDELQYFTGLKSLGNGIFSNCTFGSLKLPENLENIGPYVFYWARIGSLYSLNTLPPFISETATYSANFNSIIVPAESIDAHKNTKGWNDYSNKIQSIPE